MKNALWYLGFLSLLSLLYFLSGEIAYLGFLGFLAYFSLYKENDERLQKNIGNATRNANFFAEAFTLLFSGSIIICILSYFFYNSREE